MTMEHSLKQTSEEKNEHQNDYELLCIPQKKDSQRKNKMLILGIRNSFPSKFPGHGKFVIERNNNRAKEHE